MVFRESFNFGNFWCDSKVWNYYNQNQALFVYKRLWIANFLLWIYALFSLHKVHAVLRNNSSILYFHHFHRYWFPFIHVSNWNQRSVLAGKNTAANYALQPAVVPCVGDNHGFCKLKRNWRPHVAVCVEIWKWLT